MAILLGIPCQHPRVNWLVLILANELAEQEPECVLIYVLPHASRVALLRMDWLVIRVPTVACFIPK